jgi:L-alanine-DL-glutamate epimerase-like enolase superfamily enzyme
MKITGFEIESYDAESIPFRWRDGLIGGPGGKSRQCLLRVKTDAGLEGLVWMSHAAISRELVETCFAPMFLAADPLMREKIWYEVWERDRIEELPMYALGYLDVALWDIAAKAAGLPAYQVLGGHKHRAKAYASTVTMETLDDYLRLADRCLAKGYRAIKLHVWGRVHDDVQLVRRLRQHVGPGVELMLDGSAGYTLDESIRLGRAMEEADYLWLEEPMREFNLLAYEKLCATLDIAVLAAECTDGCHFNAGEWLRHGACDRLRTSWFYKGGLTGALKTAHLAEAFQVPADVHGCGWGSVHLVCALPNSLYYESLVPEECLPDATRAGRVLPDAEGWVYPPATPGLGWEPDASKRIA